MALESDSCPAVEPRNLPAAVALLIGPNYLRASGHPLFTRVKVKLCQSLLNEI